MAQQDMYGMFSNVTPEQAQAAYLNQFMVPQATLAQLNPYQQVAALVGQGAAQAGAGLGRLFGGKTSMEMEQAQMQSIMKQATEAVPDENNPDRLLVASNLASKAGLQDLSMALRDRYSRELELQGKMEQRGALVEEKKAKTALAQREEANRQQLGKFIESRIQGLPEGAGYALAGDSKVVAELLKTPKEDIKTETVTANGRVLLINKTTGQTIADLGTAKGGVGSEIAAGLAPLVGAIAGARAKEAGKAEGKEVGEAVATIQGKQDAVISLKNALDLLGNSKTGYNIYAGTWGPGKTLVSKATEGLAFDRNKAINSEQFLAEVSTTVIPMLKEFGGNDSNEELKFLQRVVGGDQSLEPESLERIIKSAKAKIERGIQRIQAQQEATQEGKPLPTGPSPMKATKRYNRATGKLEEVK